jgi:hypothetical protein
MSQPTPGDVFVSAPLTNVSLHYVQDQKASIADRMFPVVPVNIQAGIVWEFDLAYLLRNGMKPRAPNAQSEGIGNKINQKTYAAIVEALHIDVSDQRRANESAPINADRSATIQLTQQAWQRREITLKSKAFATGKWTGFADGTGVAGTPTTNQIKQWNDAASTPVKDVTTLATNLKLATGIRPNKISMGRQVWDALKYNPDIIDRIKFSSGNSSPTIVTMQAVAALFELEEILVSDVVQATSNEGAATLTTAFVIGKEFVLFYAPQSADIDTPSAGYTFAWNGYLGASALGSRMKKFRMEPNAADRIEIEQAYDQNVMSSALGGYYSTVVA